MGAVIPISEKLREAREALLNEYLEAQNSGDLDRVIATFTHPRTELMASARVLDGPDAVRTYLEESRKSFPDQHFEVVNYFHSDRAIVAELWMSGTHLGTLHEVEPSGRHFKVRMAAIFEFEGDELMGQRIYYDAGTIARQLA